jgi:hypothetical protein
VSPQRQPIEAFGQQCKHEAANTTVRRAASLILYLAGQSREILDGQHEQVITLNRRSPADGRSGTPGRSASVRNGFPQ